MAYKDKLKEKIKKQEYYLVNKERIDARNKKWNEAHREQRTEIARKYRQKHAVQLDEKTRKWQEDNRKEWLSYQKLYREKNKAILRIKSRKYDRRYRQNPQTRLADNVSRRLRSCIKKNNKRTEALLGYSSSELMKHIESLFDNKMNWTNYGTYWHIDHIVPLSSFKYENEDDEGFKKCWSLSNLQPLEAVENIRKSNKILTEIKWQ